MSLSLSKSPAFLRFVIMTVNNDQRNEIVKIRQQRARHIKIDAKESKQRRRQPQGSTTWLKMNVY